MKALKQKTDRKVRCVLNVALRLSLQRQQTCLKYVTEEWAGIEYELLRERGLWGPPIGSHLDKFVLEMTEGPCRMRKKMVRNDMFYIHYPFVPEPEPNPPNSTQVLHNPDPHPTHPTRH